MPDVTRCSTPRDPSSGETLLVRDQAHHFTAVVARNARRRRNRRDARQRAQRVDGLREECCRAYGTSSKASPARYARAAGAAGDRNPDPRSASQRSCESSGWRRREARDRAPPARRPATICVRCAARPSETARPPSLSVSTTRGREARSAGSKPIAIVVNRVMPIVNAIDPAVDAEPEPVRKLLGHGRPHPVERPDGAEHAETSAE